MATLFVRHDVKDFAKWKQQYDEFDAERRDLGVISARVFQEDGKPNNITVYHEFESMDAAKKFVSTPRLMEVMRNAGVVGPPSVWFTESA